MIDMKMFSRSALFLLTLFVLSLAASCTEKKEVIEDFGGAPGMPAFEIELLRQRGGPAGWRWRVEWDRDRVSFGQGAGAQISGDLATVPDGGSLAAGDGAAAFG